MSGNNRDASSEDQALSPEPPAFLVLGEDVINMASSDEEENALMVTNRDVSHDAVIVMLYFVIDGAFIPLLAFVLYRR